MFLETFLIYSEEYSVISSASESRNIYTREKEIKLYAIARDDRVLCKHFLQNLRSHSRNERIPQFKISVRVKMKFQNFLPLFLLLVSIKFYANGMWINDCKSEDENNVSRFLKNTNCVVNTQVSKIKTGINSIGGQIWSGVENIRDRYFKNKKDVGDMDFDELYVEETTRLKREGEEENEENSEATAAAEEEGTTNASSDYIAIDPLSILSAPRKCPSGQKFAGGRCRTIS